MSRIALRSLEASAITQRWIRTACAILFLLAPVPRTLGATPKVLFVLPPNYPPISQAVDVTFDAAGNLYVLMGGDVNQLIKVDPTGKLLWAVGSKGSGDGQFDLPQGVAVAPSGTVYVVEQRNHRVQYFSKFGFFLGKFGSECFVPFNYSGTCVDPDGDGPLELGDGQFFQPTDIAVDAAGRIYVADYNNHRVQVFSAPGVFAYKFGSFCGLDPSSTEFGIGCVDPDGSGPLALGDGQFEFPEGIAVDSAGRILVADSYNNRVQVFDAAGRFLFKLGKNGGNGEHGSGHGEFQSPSDVAADAAGHIIVVDGRRIQVFSPQGVFEHTFPNLKACDVSSCPEDQLRRPAGLAVDGAGHIVVADPGFIDAPRQNLPVYELDGTLVDTIGNLGSTDGRFGGVYDVSVGPDRKIYVGDLNGKIQVYTASGAFVSAVQVPTSPFSIAVGSDGRLLDSNFFEDVVRVLSPTGQLLFSLGGGPRCNLSTGGNCVDPDGPGPLQPGDGQFVNQGGVAFDSNGRIFVADTGNSRVQVFDAAGRFLFKFGRNGGNGSLGAGDGEFRYPGGVAVDAGGRIYVADTGNNRLQVFDAAGQFLFKIGRNGGDGTPGSGPGEFNEGGLQDVAVDATGRIYVLDAAPVSYLPDNHRIQVFSASGAFLHQFGDSGVAPGAFRSPRGLAVDSDGHVVVADSGNNRVQVFLDAAADLSLSLQGPGTVAPGAAFSYVIQVENNGPATATHVEVSDTLPPGASFLGDAVESGGCMVNEKGETTCTLSFDSNICLESAGVVSCALRGDLLNGWSGKVTLFVRAATTASGSLMNTASVGSDTTDPDPSNNDAVLVTRVSDVTPPQLNVPTNITKEATSPAGAVVAYVATATDEVDGALNPVCAPPSSATFALGHTTVNCTASDAAGNTAHASFQIAVVDTTAPAIQAPPSLTVEATGPYTTVALGTPTASDVVDPSPVVTASNTGPFALGTYSIVWTAVDASGNVAHATQTLIVADTTPPTVTPPPDVLVEATGPLTAVALGTGTAHDLVDPAPTVVPSTLGPFAVGVSSVTWTATDARGNQATAVQTVTVRDTTPPVVTPPPDVLATVTGNLTAVALGVATASDLVDGVLAATASNVGPFPPGTNTITWTAVDAHGNRGATTQKVVLHFAVSAFLGDLLPLPATNVARAGSSVPVRWQISDGSGGFIRDLSAVAAVRFAQTACDQTSSETTVQADTSGNSGLRYDAASEQYQFNWQTDRDMAGRCFLFILELADGTTHEARFRLR
jgi:uncharacterized repeat protein (TIGR01451 family)